MSFAFIQVVRVILLNFKEKQGRRPLRNSSNSFDSSKNSSLSYIELIKFVQEVKITRDKLILELLLETGITANELVNIKLKDIDFSQNILLVRAENTKAKHTRTLALSSQLIKKIKLFSNDHLSNEYLFKTRQSSSISVRRLEQILSQYRLSSRDKLTPRAIRKSYIENFLREGKSLSEIKEKCGIKSLCSKKIIKIKDYEKLKSVIKDSKHKLILDLFWQSALSLNEFINLRKSDFSFSQNILIIRPEITKSKLPRAVKISSKLSDEIQNHTRTLKALDYVFSSQKSSQISALRVRQILAHYSELASLDVVVSPQILRNSHIYFAYSRGESLELIGERLGISQLNTNYTSLLHGWLDET